jgi:hypothetical protein
LQAVRRLAQTLARYGNARRGEPIAATPDRERYEHLQPQSDHDRVRVLFRATLRRHDLVAEVWHLKEPQKLPPVLSPEEVKRVLTIATTLKARAIPDRTYDCGLRASEVHHCVAQPLPPLVQRLGVPQPKGLGVLAPRINPPHAQKTLQSGLKSAAGLLRE